MDYNVRLISPFCLKRFWWRCEADSRGPSSHTAGASLRPHFDSDAQLPAGLGLVCRQFNLLPVHVMLFFFSPPPLQLPHPPPISWSTVLVCECVFAYVNRNVWRLPVESGRGITACSVLLLIFLYITFFSCAFAPCTCNAALLNIKWRLIPGSTSTAAAAAYDCAVVGAIGGSVWSGRLFVRLHADGHICKRMPRFWVGAANVIATTFDCLAGVASMSEGNKGPAGLAARLLLQIAEWFYG